MSNLFLNEGKMSVLSIIIISFLGGGVITGGSIWAIQSNKSGKENSAEVIQAIAQLQTDFEKAQGTAVTNLTAPDLLKIPCSAEFIKEQDPSALLCREMFCRMNRQGGGQNSGGGAGATEQDCSAISGVSVNLLKIQTCMEYWEENAGNDQNSKYSRCITQFGAKP